MALSADATLSKWGNSQGLLIPKRICESIGLHVGDKVRIELEDDQIAIKPCHQRAARTKHLTIEDLFKDYEGTYIPPEDWSTVGNEIDWGQPVGKEVW